MPIQIICPRCSASYPVDDDLQGRSVRCRECGGVVFVEGPWTFDAGPPGLSPEEAESLVRLVAERHGARGILRRLGAIPEAHLVNAIDGFAAGMDHDEVALVFVDQSLLQNGKAGFLLTNRKLYSSKLRRPISLHHVREVTYRTPSVRATLGYTLGVWLFGGFWPLMRGLREVQNQLLVNGEVVYSDGNPLRGHFWVELLMGLGEAARRGPGSSTAGESPGQDWAEAGGASSGAFLAAEGDGLTARRGGTLFPEERLAAISDPAPPERPRRVGLVLALIQLGLLALVLAAAVWGISRI